MADDKNNKKFEFITNNPNPLVGRALAGTPSVGIESPEPTFSEIFSASFDREKLLSVRGTTALIERFSDPNDVDFDYNPYEDIKGTRFEEFAQEFMYAPNKEYVEKLKTTIDTQVKNQQLQAEGGLAAFLGGAAGAIYDPTTLIPVIGIGAKAGMIGRIATGAVSAGVAAGTAEALGLQADVTRTAEEAILNTAAASVFGGLLYGATSFKFKPKVSKESTDIMTKIFDDSADLSPEEVIKAAETSTNKGNFKLGKVDDGDFDLDISNNVFGLTVKATKGLSPLMRGLTNTSSKMRELTSNLLSHNLRLKGAEKGVAKPLSLEMVIKTETSKVNKTLSTVEDAFTAHKKAGGKLSRYDFETEVSKALRRGDNSSIREVGLAAKNVREYLNGFIPKMIKQGILPEDFAGQVKNAESYFTRVWDYDKIHSNHGRFSKVIEDAIIKADPSEQNVAAVRREIIDKILDDRTPLHRKMKFKSRQGRERILDLADVDIEDFLVSDLRLVLHKYAKDVNTELAFRERFGSTDLAEQISDVQKEFTDLIEKTKSEKTRAKLLKEKAKAVEDLEAMRDILQGRFGLSKNRSGFQTVESTLLGMNYLAMMGMGVVSQLPDLARFIGVTRLSKAKYFQDVFKHLDSNLKDLKLSKADLTELEIGVDSWANARALSLGDIDDFALSTSKIERGVNKITGAFSVVNLMTPMNDFTRRLASQHIARNMIDDMSAWKLGKLSDKKVKDLLKVGIDEKLRNKILTNFEKHATIKDNVAMVNLNRWGEDGLEFSAIIKEQVDNTIIMPSAGDKPLWMRKPFGRLVGQFRGFVAGAFHKALLPNLQDIAGVGGDQAMISLGRIITGIILGGAASMARQNIKGRDPEYSIEKFIVEGFDRGGVFPVIMDINNIMDRFNLGLATALGTQKVNRFRDASLLQILLGPSAGLVDEITPTLSRMARGEMSNRDTRSLLRRIPGYNLLYWNWLTDRLARN